MTTGSEPNRTKNGSTINRRGLLRAASGATAMGLFGATTVSASGPGGQGFVGVSYDTLTHMSQREATGELTLNDAKLSGHLDVGGFNVPIGADEPVEPEYRGGVIPEYKTKLGRDEFVEDGRPVTLQLRHYGDQVVGYLTRPGPDHAKLSFTMGDVEEGYTAAGIEGGLLGSGDGVEVRGADSIPQVPGKGIPTNTAFGNITEDK